MSHQPEPLPRAAILKLEGRELDLAVARALGWPEIDEDEPFRYAFNEGKGGVICNGRAMKFRGSSIPDDNWHPATDWNAAGELLGLMAEQGMWAKMHTPYDPNNPRFPSKLNFVGLLPHGVSDNRADIESEGATMPEAISRAFLLLTLNPQA